MSWYLMTTTHYVMEHRILMRLKRARGLKEIRCKYPPCSKIIEVGDYVVAKSPSGATSNHRIWCEKCYEKVFMDV